MGQESMSECELLRAEIESLKIDLQAMLGLRRTGSTSTIEKRLERVEAILDARGLDWDHPRVEEEPAPVDFGDKDHPVVMRQTMVFSVSQSDKNQPAKESSLDGLPDIRTFAQPNLRWRILEPGEVVCSGDWVTAKTNPPSDPPSGLGWRPVDASVGTSVCEDDPCVFARPVADEPAKEPEPAWEPKVGDWVLVTRPENWKEWKEPMWQEKMHHFDGKVLQVSGASETSVGHRVTLHGIDWFFHRDWLTPSIRHFAEPPKPAEPEYREPVLPADAGQPCEFSMTGKDWYPSLLSGFQVHNTHPWISSNLGRWNFARIKKDA